MTRSTRAALCAALTLTLVACGGSKAKEDTKPTEGGSAATAPSGPPAGSQELMQGSWAGTIYKAEFDMSVTITATIEGTLLKIRDENGSEAGAKRDHDMILGTGPDGSSLTVDLPYPGEDSFIELCAATVNQGALTLCCHLDDEGQSVRPSDVQPCDQPGQTALSFIRQ